MVMILTYLYYWYFTIYLSPPLLFHIMINHYASEAFFISRRSNNFNEVVQYSL